VKTNLLRHLQRWLHRPTQFPKNYRDRRRSRTQRIRSLQRVGTRLLLVLGAFVLFVGLPLAVWKGPYILDGRYLSTDTIGDGVGSATLVTGLRQTMVACVAPIGVGIALIYTARNYRLTRRGQVTDRFTKALERLDSEHIYVRIGGILALEQIVRDAPEQATDAAEVLQHFVRHLRPPMSSGRPDADVQAALTALSRPESRTHVDRHQLLDMTGTWLVGAQLPGADFSHAELSETQFSHSRLREADLTNAQLRKANLTKADLSKANLTGAELEGADLTNALLRNANLTDAFLNEVDLTHASLSEANLDYAWLLEAELTHADLKNAKLTNADLSEANLTGAILFGADLSNAKLHMANLTHAKFYAENLSTAKMPPKLHETMFPPALGVTVEQILSADSLYGIQLPPGIAQHPEVAARLREEGAGGHQDHVAYVAAGEDEI
jgi:uncharacterized protein YjbI with pentapeptide repeats